jgi:hypothetical protein
LISRGQLYDRIMHRLRTQNEMPSELGKLVTATRFFRVAIHGRVIAIEILKFGNTRG